MEDTMKVSLLGVRGSVPVSGNGYMLFGGATTCVRIDFGGRTLFLDAGTGLLKSGRPEGDTAILLTHAHIDHLMGLTAWAPLFSFDKGRGGTRISIVAAPRFFLHTRQQLSTLMTPLLWPVGPESYSPLVEFEDLSAPFFLGDLSVTGTEGKHPGGCMIYKVSAPAENGKPKSLVFATDCELTEKTCTALSHFAENCDLLLVDGQYTDREYEKHRGWGHSSLSMAARFAGECGAARTVLIHHDPMHDDRRLAEMEESLAAMLPGGSLGREGEVIVL